jgi:hypothetical protein
MPNSSNFQPDTIDSDLDLELPEDMEERGRVIAYYLDQLAEELPSAMLYAGGEVFTWLYKSASGIGEIAAQQQKIAELD